MDFIIFYNGSFYYKYRKFKGSDKMRFARNTITGIFPIDKVLNKGEYFYFEASRAGTMAMVFSSEKINKCLTALGLGKEDRWHELTDVNKDLIKGMIQDVGRDMQELHPF